jgi:pimeloyl-ACP methyl ester carboxylesterase
MSTAVAVGAAVDDPAPVVLKAPSPSPPSQQSCCAYDPGATSGRCLCWRRANCRWRCGYVCCSVSLSLVLIWSVYCLASLCCVEVSCEAYPGFPAGHPAAAVPVLFVHGFTGSTLLDASADNAVRYLTGLQAIGLDAPPLGQPPTWVGDAGRWDNVSAFSQSRDSLVAGDVVNDVTLASCIRVPVYRKWTSWASRCMNRPYSTFVFDWRRDPMENAAKLVARIRQVSAAHGNARVQLVGHSNGGVLSLIATNLLHATNETGALIHSAVYVGVPFKGSYGLLRTWESDGIVVGLSNKKSLDARAALTVSGYYVFLPLVDGPDDDDSYLVDGATGAVVRPNLTDPMTFVTNKWAQVDGPADPYFGALSNALRRARLARSHLVPLPNVVYPQAVVVASRSLSIANGNFTVDAATGRIDWANPRGREGSDGSVRFSAAMPPTPYIGVEEADPSLTHSYLLDDNRAVMRAMMRIAY